MRTTLPASKEIAHTSRSVAASPSSWVPPTSICVAASKPATVVGVAVVGVAIVELAVVVAVVVAVDPAGCVPPVASVEQPTQVTRTPTTIQVPRRIAPS
jgi:hypothetical protein